MPVTRRNHELADALLTMAKSAIPAPQCLLVLTALLDTPSTGDRDRPITLLSFLYRSLVRHQEWMPPDTSAECQTHAPAT